ncbi:MAG: 23S rRNA (uracil(1939)-C(5))-methyltransferase RlmD [Bacteroidia bacterium]|nr:23S rRNA (uracil(1939)-C(5))-methyltransferase RlmD [Bacteroidia bacterium]
MRVCIQDVASEGYGIAKSVEHPVLFVPFTLEGEEVEVEIVRRKKQIWYGQATHWYKQSPHRVEAACRDFGRCGGCRWQMMNYEEQLRYKRRFVEQALHHIGRLSVEVPLPIPSPQIWHYRNKAEYAFGTQAGELTLGFHPRGAFDQVIGIQTCQIVPQAFEQVRKAVLRQAQALSLPAYDPRRHKGFLRSLLVRGTEEKLIAILVLAEDQPAIAEAILTPILSFPFVQGIGYIHNPRLNDSLQGLEPSTLAGTLSLSYSVAGMEYLVAPNAFFQVNLGQAEAMVAWIRQRISSRAKVLYDIYGGVGLFGLGLAPQIERVVLLEQEKQAVESARQNFLHNQHRFPNTIWEIGEGKAEIVFSEAELAPFSIAVLDPPREGLHPRLRRALRKAPFSEVFYVSCHPAAQARDLAEIQSEYEIVEVQPFDLFPHTTSVENIVWLRRRED